MPGIKEQWNPCHEIDNGESKIIQEKLREDKNKLIKLNIESLQIRKDLVEKIHRLEAVLWEALEFIYTHDGDCPANFGFKCPRDIKYDTREPCPFEKLSSEELMICWRSVFDAQADGDVAPDDSEENFKNVLLNKFMDRDD